MPAVAAVVDTLAQHAHAVQPGTCSADAAQQQLPAQKFVPQSAAESQGSPGENKTQEPVPGRHAAQPNAAAAALQQNPERHSPVAHAGVEEPGAQGAPGGNRGEVEGDALEEGVVEGEVEEVTVEAGVGEDEEVEVPETEGVGEDELENELDGVVLHEGAKASPLCTHKEGHGQARQVALVEAPVTLENLPAGQGTQAEVPFAYVPAGQVDAVYAQVAAPCTL